MLPIQSPLTAFVNPKSMKNVYYKCKLVPELSWDDYELDVDVKTLELT